MLQVSTCRCGQEASPLTHQGLCEHSLTQSERRRLNTSAFLFCSIKPKPWNFCGTFHSPRRQIGSQFGSLLIGTLLYHETKLSRIALRRCLQNCCDCGLVEHRYIKVEQRYRKSGAKSSLLFTITDFAKHLHSKG